MSQVVKEALCEELGDTITIERGEDGNWFCVNGCGLHRRKGENLKRVVVGGVVEKGQSGVAGCYEKSETEQEEKLIV